MAAASVASRNLGQPASTSTGGSEPAPAKEKPSSKASKKEDKGKKAKANSKSKAKSSSKPQLEKPKSLVEELKLFQNNQLLNQQDPIEQLHRQLDKLMVDKDDQLTNGHPATTTTTGNDTSCLSNSQLNSDLANQYKRTDVNGGGQLTNHHIDHDGNMGETSSTVKKGVLWQQQQFEKFHQRLFSRWKKRYFILTTDYLVCFKRSSSKVGRSEMGRFLYKTSLQDINGIDWSKPNKSDRGPIVLQISGQHFSLYLWSKKSLDDWMFMLKESIDRYKLKKSCVNKPFNHRPIDGPSLNHRIEASCRDIPSSERKPIMPNGTDDLYENTVPSLQKSQANTSDEPTISNHRSHSNTSTSNGSTKLESSKRSTDAQSKKLPSNVADNQSASDVSKSLKSQSSLESDKPKPKARGKAADNDCSVAQRQYSLEKVGNLNGVAQEGGRPIGGGSLGDNGISEDKKGKCKPGMINGADDNDGSLKATGSLARLDDGSQSASANSGPKGQVCSTRQAAQNRSDEKSNNLSSKLSQEDDFDDNTRAITSNASSVGRISTSGSSKASSGSSGGRKLKSAVAQNRSDNDSEKSLVKSSENGNKEQQIKTASSDDEEDADKRNKGTFTKSSLAKLQNNHTTKPNEQQQLQSQPRSNLIRRDDSWQSLVSLTKIGKVAPMPATSPAIAQRSLYAQHIMPEASNNDVIAAREALPNNSARNSRQQNLISLESTVTPIRSGASASFRQQTIQELTSSNPRMIMRPSFQQHAASFDTPASGPMSPLQQYSTSYKQKLLQLQLLHNSNNVDYIRSNGDGEDNYTIYGGPDASINGGHYGYSSMKSNLKSAASEFSFIRPSPSSYIQTTLPHQPKHLQQQNLHHQFVPTADDNNNFIINRHHAVRSSLVLPKTGSPAFKQQFAADHNNNAKQQFLINPVTGERITQQPGEQLAMMTPPMRELPTKPSKRRENELIAGNGAVPKSSSLTSSIACFFRRAFSRRSKRRASSKKRSKLADQSCSSSVGALGECYANVPIVPSAFSTGSKSIDERNGICGGPSKASSQRNNNVQSQKMIEMIEAMASSTSANQSNCDGLPVCGNAIEFNSAVKAPPSRMSSVNQFGSPLHKSNSISTTMGLSHLADRANFHYDNEMTVNTNGIGAPSAGLSSPMMLRSSKVMSANLTPVMSRNHHVAYNRDYLQHNQQQQQQLFMSPKNGRNENILPRPSSIYGQPSMISSPMFTSAQRDERVMSSHNNFGVHRNSLHSHHFRDRSSSSASNAEQASQQQSVTRTRHIMKAPFSLDTTREVAEDLPSPINDYGNRQHQFDEFNRVSASPSSGALMGDGGRQNKLINNQRQAIVNPILQSPTMNTIYDNHPRMMMVDSQNLENLSAAAYSHYDNHNHLIMEQQQSRMLNSPMTSRSNRLASNSMMQFLPTSPMARDSNNFANQTSTPSRSPSLSANKAGSSFPDHSDKRPSAIVAPSANETGSYHHKSPTLHHRQSDYQQQPHMAAVASRSPMMSRRPGGGSHYQQSPLVSQQTKLLNKRDGVQATVIGNHQGNYGQRYMGQPVVNIAGAPGINLEPALAASLIRGTNINAYESSEPIDFDSRQSGSSTSYTNQCQANPKTFLVSTRLSKSMAQNAEQSSGNSSQRKNSTSSDSCKDDYVDAPSRNIPSNKRPSSSSKAVKGNPPERNESSSLSSESSSQNSKRKKLRDNEQAEGNQIGHSSVSSSRGKRDSTSELPSDEGSSITGGSFDRSIVDDERRNWITSKLVED